MLLNSFFVFRVRVRIETACAEFVILLSFRIRISEWPSRLGISLLYKPAFQISNIVMLFFIIFKIMACNDATAIHDYTLPYLFIILTKFTKCLRTSKVKHVIVLYYDKYGGRRRRRFPNCGPRIPSGGPLACQRGSANSSSVNIEYLLLYLHIIVSRGPQAFFLPLMGSPKFGKH